MKKATILAICFVLMNGVLQKATAQYYFYDNYSYDNPVVFEFGAALGGMNCLTDIGGKKGLGKPFIKDLNMGITQLNGGVYLSGTYKEALALRLEGTWGKIAAYDSILANVKETTNGRYERNLHFKSKISEVTLMAEFHPLFMFIDWAGRDQEPPRFSPYLMGGVGYFSFNPQAKNRDGQWVDLQPLSTEGQGFASYPERQPYKLSQLNIPFGFGVRYELSGSFNLRAEVIHRITNTDYLDDVSSRYIDPAAFATEGGFTGLQLRDALDLYMNNRHNPQAPGGPFRKSEGGIRGDPTDKDSYFTFNLKIGYVFGRESR